MDVSSAYTNPPAAETDTLHTATHSAATVTHLVRAPTGSGLELTVSPPAPHLENLEHKSGVANASPGIRAANWTPRGLPRLEGRKKGRDAILRQ